MIGKINESGYRRARELMDAGENRDLAPMIKAVANQETEWLEVKANPFMPAKDDPFYVEGENADYYEWTNLIKPLIALSNFHGGVLLLGIKEDKQDGGKFKAVPLKNRNHEVVDEAGFDGFKNELAACFGKSKFEFKDVAKGKDMTYETTRPLSELISYEPHKAFYQGELVLAIFVRVSDCGVAVTESSRDRHAELVPHPDKKGNDIYPTEERSKMAIYLVRCPGEQGRVEAKVFESDADLKSYRMRNIGAACKDRIRNYYGAISLVDADALVGRLDECNEVSKILDEGKYPLITGGAGIGKTSVATKLAQKWVGGCAQGCVVVKVDAEKMEKLEEAFLSGDFRRLIESQSGKIQWANRNDATEVCKEVLAWLQLHGIKCLVIYDNIEKVYLFDKSEISRFCGYDGAELVSFCFVSRRHGARRDTGMIEPYELADLSEGDALQLLEQRNPCQNNAEEKSAALGIVRLPEVAGCRAWVLDIISAQMKFDEVPSYRYMLKRLKRDLSGTIVDAGEGGEVMTPSVREGKSTVQKLLEPSLTIFDEKLESLNLLLLSLFLPPDGFGGDEISELYRCVFGLSPEIDEEDWPYEFARMKQLMVDRHIWLKAGDGLAMHRLTAEGVRGKYGKELSGVWARIATYLEKCVTAKIDLRRITTVLSVLSAATGMGFADDVRRLCLDTKNLVDSHFLSRAIEFCIDNCDLRGLIDSLRSEDSVAAIYMCAQYDVACSLSNLRPANLRSAVDALINIIEGNRSDDETDVSTSHYVALAYQLLGDIFLCKLSEQCAFSCYCRAVEIMCGHLKWNSHPDVLRAVNRLYDVGRYRCHWSKETSRRVLELNERLGASLDLAFRCRREGDYEYANLSDSAELQLQSELAEMDGEDGSIGAQGYIRARLDIPLKWYRKCADILNEIGMGQTSCFLVECYMAELYEYANSVLCDYGGAEDLRQESVRRFSEIVDKYDLVNTDEFKEFCRGGKSAVENAGGNEKFLCRRLLKYVQEMRKGAPSTCPDALDRLFGRLSVNSCDMLNSYGWVEENYFSETDEHYLKIRKLNRSSSSRYEEALEGSVDLIEMKSVADRILSLLSRFLKQDKFEIPVICDVLGITSSEFHDAYYRLEPLRDEVEEFLVRLAKSYDVKGLVEEALNLLAGMIQLWDQFGLDERWCRDMETLGGIYFSRQNYKASLRTYNEINRKAGRGAAAAKYAYERCRCCELMNDSEAVQQILQDSQGDDECQLLAVMAELCGKLRLPRFEWYVKRMIKLSTAKIEAIRAALRVAGGCVEQNDEMVNGSALRNVAYLCDDVSHLRKELESRSELYKKIGEQGLCAQDKLEAERLAIEADKLAIELCSSKIEAFKASLQAAGGFVVRNEKTGEESESGDVVRLYKELKSRAELYEKIGAKELCAKDNADAEKLAKEVRERLPGRFMIWMIDGL